MWTLPCPERRRLLLSLAGGLLGTGARAATLRVFADDDYYPLIHRQGDRPVGLLVERLLASRPFSGDQFAVELVGLNRALLLAERGQGAVLGLSYTQERARWMDFSKPLMHDDIAVVVRRGQGFPFRGLPDLYGKTIGLPRGASFGEALDQAIAQGRLKAERDWALVRRLRMLLAGRLDAAVIGGGALSLQAALERDPELRSQRARFELLPQPLYLDPLHLGVPKSMQLGALLERLNQALERMPPAPTLRR